MNMPEPKDYSWADGTYNPYAYAGALEEYITEIETVQAVLVSAAENMCDKWLADIVHFPEDELAVENACDILYQTVENIKNKTVNVMYFDAIQQKQTIIKLPADKLMEYTQGLVQEIENALYRHGVFGEVDYEEFCTKVKGWLKDE
jgi:hypothetical protein